MNLKIEFIFYIYLEYYVGTLHEDMKIWSEFLILKYKISSEQRT